MTTNDDCEARIETKRNACIKHNLNIMDQDYYKKVKEGVLCDKEIGR